MKSSELSDMDHPNLDHDEYQQLITSSNKLPTPVGPPQKAMSRVVGTSFYF
jgi:hypothetical protein